MKPELTGFYELLFVRVTQKKKKKIEILSLVFSFNSEVDNNRSFNKI
jgi:hypothetical protein